MKVFFINIGNSGSTGKIVQGLAAAAESKGMKVVCAYPDNKNNRLKRDHDYIIETVTQKLLTRELTYITGLEGGLSFWATYKLIKKMRKFKPDIIHLHTLHGWYLNLRMLFKYIDKEKVNVVWTLHDCWSFTGHCTHFQKTECNKWKTGCYACKQLLDTPKSYIDHSKRMYNLKRKLFTGVNNLTIVTPSKWLADNVRQSFLKEKSIEVINNGIDLDIFKPTESKFRVLNDLVGKKLILGVSSVWGERKGLDVFLRLSQDVDSDYQIVLVGVSEEIEETLPQNILAIRRTNNQAELAEIYSACDVFVNPTREDTFPTVNIESLACGCPVITFDVCGCSEIIDENSGFTVEKDDYDDILKKIDLVCKKKQVDRADCVKRAQNFDEKKKVEEYFRIYEKCFESGIDP